MEKAGKKTEEIMGFIEKREKDILEFALGLVKTNSENPPGDETAVAGFISSEATGKWGLPFPETWSAKKNRPNLIFKIELSKSQTQSIFPVKTLILQAHMDTKPVGDTSKWKNNPSKPQIKNGMLFGRGSADMKGAIAGIIAATGSLAATDSSLCGDIVLALSADEEAGSNYGSKVLVEKKLEGSAILIAEPSGAKRDFDSLGIACRGALLGKIVVYGTQMHSSLSDQGGCINASIKMAEVMLEFAKNLKSRLYYKPHFLYPNGPTINPGVLLEGGIYYGVIPGQAGFGFDIRTIPGMEHKRLTADIKKFLNDLMKADSSLKAELVLEKPPLDKLEPAEIDGQHELVLACRQATAEVLGFEPVLMGVPFSTDAIYLSNQLRIPTIPSFGPGLIKYAHVPDECISVKAIIDSAKIFALAALKYLGIDE